MEGPYLGQEEAARVQVGIAQIFPRVPVILVGAGLGYHVDIGARRPAESAGVHARRDLHLRYGFGRRNHAQPAEIRRDVGGAVQREVVVTLALSVNRRYDRQVGDPRSRIGRVGAGHGIHAGQNVDQRREIPSQQRKLRELIGIDDRTQGSGCGLEQRRRLGHYHLLHGFGDSHGDVERASLSGRQNNPSERLRLEAGDPHNQLIGPRCNGWDHVLPGGVGDGLTAGFFRGTRQSDLRCRNGGAGGIGDNSTQGSRSHLGGQGRARQQKDSKQF